MTYWSARRTRAWSGLAALLAVACTTEDGDPSLVDGAVDASALDGGGDARAPAELDSGRLDAAGDAAPSRVDAQADARADGGSDAQADPQSACERANEELTTFVRTHRQCASDADCAIIGGCSQTLGFYAVRADARDAGQPLTESHTCGGSDGPTYEAVCENQQCVTRYDGNACGSISSKCQSSHELYAFSCPSWAPLQDGTCHQRCSGASDTRCAADFSCQQREVVAAEGGCTVARVPTWLCAPKPSCEVVLALESAGSKSRMLLPGSATPAPLELWAVNPTAQPKTFTYRPRCGGELFSGLGTYDAWGACLAGQCDPNPAPKQVTIPAGQRVSLGTANVQAAPSTCNAGGLAAGEYNVAFSLSEVQGATVCAPEPLELRVR